ncbi:MAG: sugar ABC transporter substrate-binding protein [Phycisphaerae bacterium]
MYALREQTQTLAIAIVSTFLATVAFWWLYLPMAATPPESKPVVLNYMGWGRESEIRELRAKFDEFERDNPDIKVAITHVTGLYQTKLATMLAGGIGPDVFQLMDAMLPALAERRLLLTLDDMVAADHDINLNEFFPQVVESCRYQPQWSTTPRLYRLPTSFMTVVMYYNRDLFDAAGVPYPDDNWTWDDFRQTARRLTRRDANGHVSQFGCMGIGPWLSFLLFMWQNGGECFDHNGKLVIGKPEYLAQNVEALQFCADLTFEDKVQPNGSALQTLPHNPFTSGKVAMMLNGSWEINDLKRFKEFRWALAPLPRRANRGTLIFPGGAVINSQTKHPQAAWRLLKFFTLDYQQQAILRDTPGLPAKRAIAGRWHNFVQDYPPEARIDVAFDALAFARRQPCGREISPLLDNEIAKENEKIMSGMISRDGIKQALLTIQKNYDATCPYCSLQTW